MRRIMATSLAVGALLALAGCKTDNQPVHASPPSLSQEPPQAPTAQTLAWTDQAVSDALAAEKTARAAGGDDKAVVDAIHQAIDKDVTTFMASGTPEQLLAGIKAAIASPRNTPSTLAAFHIVLSEITVQPTGGGQGCPECKGT